MPRSSNSRLVGTIRQPSSMPTSITTRIQQYREEAAASPRLSDDAKLAVKRHREDRANASMASCASHDDSNHPPSEVLGNFEVSDFSKNFVVIRILPGGLFYGTPGTALGRRHSPRTGPGADRRAGTSTPDPLDTVATHPQGTGWGRRSTGIFPLCTCHRGTPRVQSVLLNR